VTRSLTRWIGGGLLAAAICGSPDALAALDAEEARAAAARELEDVRTAMTELAPGELAPRSPRSPEKLIALGELALRSGDHQQAIDTLDQVVELFRQGKASPAAHADAAFLLGQAYFEAGQLLSARRQYADVLSRARREPYAAYGGRSLARLVDIAVQSGRREMLDALAAEAEALPRDATGSLDYGRGKLGLAQHRFSDAKRALLAVPATSPWYHQAQYVLGVTLMQEGLVGAGLGPAEERSRLVIPDARDRFASALAQFQLVAQLPADSTEHREVIDAAHLAIGRLCYETQDYLEAARAFIAVGQKSKSFHDMLHELAWVYVRVGDYERAERALELLGVAAPDTLDVADSALLRADLMLRTGRFERALQAYEGVRSRFLPTRQRVDEFLASSADPAVYYDLLVEEGLPFGGSSGLPDVVMGWARDQARDGRVFALIEAVADARDLLRRARQLASKLSARLAAPSRSQAFPELKAAMEKALGLANQIARGRRLIAIGLDDVESSEPSGELAETRRARRGLMAKVTGVPVTPADFLRREEQGQERWNELSQALQRATLESDKLQAVINGLQQVLDGSAGQGAGAAGGRARFQAQVAAHQRELATYRARIDAYREEVEAGRVQVGLGDVRYVEDARIRKGFRELLGREVDLLASGAGDEDSRDYARSIAPLLAEMAALEHRLDTSLRGLEAEVARGADELVRLVAEERDRIRLYGEQLDALDDNARLLVGQVAMDNFASVRERLRGIVLRADVGIVQQAWELREEQQSRLQSLQRRRAVEEENLENELREVVDDVGAPK
jgi:tetratricopeptide (TPR) repeat protein